MTSPLNATSSDAGRSYLWPPTGETYPSVTTILQQGTPTPPQLLAWINRTNAWYAVEHASEWLPMAEVDPRGVVDHLSGAADRARDAAADRGTEIHAWAEAIAQGTAQGCPPPEIAGYVEAFGEFLDDWNPAYVHTEATVYSRSLGYAGTFDWMAWIGGRLVLGDIKSKEKGRRFYGDSVALQLAAYRYADFIGLPDGTELPMPAVEDCVTLILRPSSYELVPVRADKAIFEVFAHILKVREYLSTVAPSVLGSPLTPERLS